MSIENNPEPIENVMDIFDIENFLKNSNV